MNTLFTSALRDVRHACRSIVRMPVLAAVVIASLGAGIGVNTVVFSWIQGIVFQVLPGVPHAGEFHLIETHTDTGLYPGVSWSEYRDLRERVGSFRALLAYRMVPLYLGESGRVERAYGQLVSDNYFSGLGLRPALGRFFRTEEVAKPGGDPVVVISHEFWQTRFNGATDAEGRILRVNGRNVTVIGVGPRGFQGTILGMNFDLWLPATLAPEVLNGSRELEDRTVRGYSVLGRLRENVSVAQAHGEVDAALRALAQAYPATNATIRGEVLPITRPPRGPQRMLSTALAILQGIMLLLLLAVCGNTANLVLARASARQREMGVRLALGAGPPRIIRLLLTENIVLALAGAVLGVGIALWTSNALRAIPPIRGLPIKFQTGVDEVTLIFAAVLGVASGVIFGIAPAVQLARVDPLLALRSGSKTAGRSLIRNLLMGGQVALALIVLIVAGLFLRSFLQTRDAETGFRREGVLLAAYDLTGRNLSDVFRRDFVARLLAEIRALPNVENAAIASSVPLDIHGLPSRFFTVEGRARADADPDQALANTVTPAYFATMGIPLRAGSDFADLKDTAAGPQAIVNEEFVRRYLDRSEPIGRQLQARGRQYAIVGVVRNSVYNAFGEPPLPIIYFSYRDAPTLAGEIHVRTRAGSETSIAPEIRRVVRNLDSDLPVYNIRTMNEHIETNLIFRRIPARMFAVLGPLLLVLASIGIYAVVAYTASLRTTEIGVRIALGATGRRIVVQFVGEHLGVIGAGMMAGWLLAFVLAVDVVAGNWVDAPVFVAVAAMLLVVATAACWIPARRATRVDPMVALRQE